MCDKDSASVHSLLSDVEQIYKPPSSYVLNAQLDMKLAHDLHILKKSVGDFKKSVENLKKDENAAMILNFFQVNLQYFETWLKEILELGKANQLYVSVVSDHDKKLITNQQKSIVKLDAMLLQKLVNLIKKNEKIASEQRNDIERTANLIHYEMVQLKNHLINIDKKLKGGDLSSLKDLKPALSLENILMKEVDHNLNSCETAKNQMSLDVEKIMKNRNLVKK